MSFPLEAAQALSVQRKPDTDKNAIAPLSIGGWWYRGPLLPPWGSRERERVLRQFWHHDYNTLFRGAIHGLIKRVQSTPWRVDSPDMWGDYFQRLLMEADFGDWDRFISKLVIDYSRQDQGGMIEIIAPGPSDGPPLGPPVGISVLDSVRCYPTGDPEYPIIYMDVMGAMHRLHQGRVVQIADGLETEEDMPGYGDCALSRCIAPVNLEIMIGRYMQTALDDTPPPGIAVFGNISENEMQRSELIYQNQQLGDDRLWGRTLRLYALDASEKPTVEFINYGKPPDEFDFEKYTALNAKKIALGIGLDIQDIWELSGGAGLGTGTQSEILAQKSRGKAFGRTLKVLERTINRMLPADVEFTWEYQDPQEDMEAAQKAQIWVSSAQTTSELTTAEKRQLLANQVPAFADVLLDDKGNITSLNDQDPKPTDTSLTDSDGTGIESPAEDAQGFMLDKAKAYASTAIKFADTVARFARNAEGQNIGALRAAFRDDLYQYGEMAYFDGIRSTGSNPDDLDAEERADARRSVAEWVASNAEYITKFVATAKSGMSKDAATLHASLWANKSLSAIYYAGITAAKSGEMRVWRLGKTEKHCKTCLQLNGQIHKMKDWTASGFVPKASTLECKGFNCDCRLSKVAAGTKASGTLPSYRVRNNPGIVDRIAGFLRGLVGG